MTLGGGMNAGKDRNSTKHQRFPQKHEISRARFLNANRKAVQEQIDMGLAGGQIVANRFESPAATVERVSPNPKRMLSEDLETLIRKALDTRDRAETHWRAVVVDAAEISSVRTVAEFTGLSTSTIMRWKADVRD